MKRSVLLIVLCAVGCSSAPPPAPPGKGQSAPVTRESSNARTDRLKSLVRVTHNPADVAGCKAMGTVGGGGPALQVTRGDGIWNFDPPRHDTDKLGGNTLLTSDGTHGTAYLCPAEAAKP
ncbi:MAG TPA: hypothetical protein VGG65_07555 [Thermoanaerobaculia bacterium]|jgi:hypothetical protein